MGEAGKAEGMAPVSESVEDGLLHRAELVSDGPYHVVILEVGEDGDGGGEEEDGDEEAMESHLASDQCVCFR